MQAAWERIGSVALSAEVQILKQENQFFSSEARMTVFVEVRDDLLGPPEGPTVSFDFSDSFFVLFCFMSSFTVTQHKTGKRMVTRMCT